MGARNQHILILMVSHISAHLIVVTSSWWYNFLNLPRKSDADKNVLALSKMISPNILPSSTGLIYILSIT